MNSLNRNHILAGAIALAFASGAAHAGGTVGNIPFDGDGSGSGFTIDHAGFSAADVTAAPCPADATCANGTATSGDMLMREVEVDGNRFIQTIIVDLGGGQGDFIVESMVSSGGDADTYAAKIIIDDAARNFYTGQSFYRGALFGGGAGNNNITVGVHQNISGGFQTFDMATLQAPNLGANGNLRNGSIQIHQAGAGGAQVFGHTILAGSFQTSAGTLTAGEDSITFAAGNALSATWIGGSMAGGGPGVIEAPGQTQNHDTRTADQRDFGLLIYRNAGGASFGNMGNGGGQTAAGDGTLVSPQFTQNAFAEARAFSGPDPLLQNSNLMYNPDHGSFTGGAAILANDWDDAVFGENPY